MQVESPVASSFNEEELIVMNRLAYYLFRLKGQNATYFMFVSKLTALQDGSFSKKLNLWLQLVRTEQRMMLDDVQKQEVLTRDEIELLLGAHMVQDQLRISSQEKILQRLFQSAELDGHGRTTLSIQDIQQKAKQDSLVRGFF